MTNGHDSGGGMGTCVRDAHEGAAKPKELPKTPRPVVRRDDKKAEATVAKTNTPGE